MNDLEIEGAACRRYHVLHETSYGYQTRVTLSQQYVHMTPRTFAYQQTQSHQIRSDPAEDNGIEGADYFGNSTKHLVITQPHTALLVSAESTVTLFTRHVLEQFKDAWPWELVRDTLLRDKEPASLDACRFLYESPHVVCSGELADYARMSYTNGRSHLDAALDLTHRIFDDFEFDDTATDISTPLVQVFEGRRGVCQDFAHLMIGCLRSLGLPARYVSGYILTHPPEGQPRMIGADASHAWVSVYCPHLGWVDFDPTNRCLVQCDHITLGWGRDYSDVTPMRGVVLGGGEQALSVRVTVTPIATAMSLSNN